MIKFFRHIRRSLINEHKMGKYFKYAIGEILLVVIGILIALQINNWNESQNLKALQKEYLIGILDDLKTDTTNIKSVIRPNFRDRHRSWHRYIDSIEQNNLLTVDSLIDKAMHPATIATSGASFFPTVGTYNALISNGNSGLIENQELFNAIQNLYEIWYKKNDEHNLRRDKMMDEVRFRYAYNFKYQTKKEMFQNKNLLADLNFMYHNKREYVNLLNKIEAELTTLIQGIEANISEN